MKLRLPFLAMISLIPKGPFYAQNGGGSSLFSQEPVDDETIHRPLAERMRPKTLQEFVGQKHLVGSDGALQPLLSEGSLHSMIFWGDPGVGKTTLARIIASHVEAAFIQLSAITSGVKDVRTVIEKGRYNRTIGQNTVLFIDEIHRFNKSQQDALLHAVEEGIIILIGATTENPSFEVISPLLSRCRVYRFNPLLDSDLIELFDRVLVDDPILKKSEIRFEDKSAKVLIDLARGDARELLNLTERCVERGVHQKINPITIEVVESVAQQALSRYDKDGEAHYDTISAFIKSVRNSDPDAAIYWLARMLAAGEEPRFIARRLIILASEDIGNANPNGLLLAQAAFDAVHVIGMPEGRIILGQVTTYLAASPKSNASYNAINEALDMVKSGVQPPVPLHLRNAVTGLMKDHGYGDGYKYAHSEVGAVTDMPGLPPELEGHKFYRPTQYGSEAQISKRLSEIEEMRNSAKKKSDEGEESSS
jgi:putative ATPase